MQHDPLHDKTNRMTYASSEDSDQPGHLPGPIRVFAVCSMGRLAAVWNIDMFEEKNDFLY